MYLRNYPNMLKPRFTRPTTRPAVLRPIAAAAQGGQRAWFLTNPISSKYSLNILTSTLLCCDTNVDWIVFVPRRLPSRNAEKMY